MADVFCLTDKNGQILNPSIQATTLAKYSRSPLSARELLKDLTSDAANKFQEKWVIAYGHSSVAELASVPICLEGVSIIASKYLESFQRAGYSEKSTRYQEFDKNSFITPPDGPDSMKEFASKFYGAYASLLPKIQRVCAIKMGKDPDDPKTSNDRTVKARAFDNVRYLLPAGTGTNLAAVMNMRDARDMVKGLRGHTNNEFKMLGDQVCEAITEVAPSLVKHAEPDENQLYIRSLGSMPEENFKSGCIEPYVRMIDTHHRDPRIIQTDFVSKIADYYHLGWTAFCEYMNGRPEHKEIPTIFRTIDMTFEIMMDYGAFRDLQRHRRCEQFIEPLGTLYGYVVPDDIINTEHEAEYRTAMELIKEYQDEDVIYNSDYMQYMIPLGYLHKSRFKMDMAELYYICELRTKPQGHISYRRIAYDMYEKAKEVFPELMQWCRVIKPDRIGIHK